MRKWECNRERAVHTLWQLFLVCVDIKKISTNKHKGKGFRSSLFPERLAGVKGAEPPCRPCRSGKLRLPTKSVCERSMQLRLKPTNYKSTKPPAPKFKIKQSKKFISNYLKTIKCRRLETKRHSVRNGDFGFRRKAQVRTIISIRLNTIS